MARHQTHRRVLECTIRPPPVEASCRQAHRNEVQQSTVQPYLRGGIQTISFTARAGRPCRYIFDRAQLCRKPRTVERGFACLSLVLAFPSSVECPLFYRLE